MLALVLGDVDTSGIESAPWLGCPSSRRPPPPTNRVDFAKPLNPDTAAIPLIIGIADFNWHAGNLTFTGIALGSIAALLVYHGMRLLGFSQAKERSDAADPAAERH